MFAVKKYTYSTSRLYVHTCTNLMFVLHIQAFRAEQNEGITRTNARLKIAARVALAHYYYNNNNVRTHCSHLCMCSCKGITASRKCEIDISNYTCRCKDINVIHVGSPLEAYCAHLRSNTPRIERNNPDDKKRRRRRRIETIALTKTLVVFIIQRLKFKNHVPECS